MPSGTSRRFSHGVCHGVRLRACRCVLAGLLVVPLLTTACATTSRYQPPPGVTISEAERKACEAFAAAETRSISTAQRAGQSGVEGAGQGLLAGLIIFPPFGALLTVPIGIIAGSVSGARDARRERAQLRESALQVCLEPIVLTQTRGPDDPAVATSLVALAVRQQAAGRFAEAEALYGRAVAVYDRAAPEADPPGHVVALEGYAKFLRERQRETEAAALEARAREIPALFGPKASLSPTSHDFGSMKGGITSPAVVFTVKNTGRQPVEIPQVYTSAPAFRVDTDACTGHTLPLDGTCTIATSFAPGTNGDHGERLHVVIRANGFLDAIGASLTGTGEATSEPSPAGGSTALPLKPEGVRLPSAVDGLVMADGHVWVTTPREQDPTPDQPFWTLRRLTLRHSLSRVDAATGTITGSPISVGAFPAFGAGAFWSIDVAEGAVLRTDPTTGETIAAIRMGSGPRSLSEIAVGSEAVWVVNRKDCTITRINPHTRRVLATIHRPAQAGVTLPCDLRNLAVSDRAVWLTEGTGNPPLSERESLPPPSGRPVDLGALMAAPRGPSPEWCCARVLRIDPAQNQVVATTALPPAQGPYPISEVLGLRLAVGQGVWVRAHDLVRIDPETDQIAGSIPYPPAPQRGCGRVWNDHLIASDGALWLLTGDCAYHFDPAGRRVVATHVFAEITHSMGTLDAAAWNGRIWLLAAGRYDDTTIFSWDARQAPPSEEASE